MKSVKATVLYDGTGNRARKNVYVIFDDRRILEISKERKGSEVIAEGIVTPGFVDAHSHIGMARHGEPYYEDESNEEMESIKTQLLNMSAKPKRSNETNSEDESDWSLGKKKENVCSISRNF